MSSRSRSRRLCGYWWLSWFLSLRDLESRESREQTSFTDVLLARVCHRSHQSLRSVLESSCLSYFKIRSISFLESQGPYNTVVEWKSEDQFSIDGPLGTWTILLGYVIMIEIDTARGMCLVCLALRGATNYCCIKDLNDYESVPGEGLSQ